MRILEGMWIVAMIEKMGRHGSDATEDAAITTMTATFTHMMIATPFVKLLGIAASTLMTLLKGS